MQFLYNVEILRTLWCKSSYFLNVPMTIIVSAGAISCYDISRHNADDWIMYVFTRGQFWPSGIVVACVCLCVRLSVRQSRACPHDNSSPV